MIALAPQARVLLARDPVDFRRGIDGLVRVCRDSLGSDPFSGAVFAFRNRPGTAIKLLVYDGQGFWLCHKRLSTLSLCTCQATGSKLPPFKRYTQPSPYQKRAFDLLQLTPP